MKKTFCFLLAGVCFLLSNADAQAKVTGLQVTPKWPALGSQFNVTTIDDGTGPPVVGTVWCYFLSYPPDVTGWYSMVGAATGTTMTAGTPGFYTIAVYVTYAPMSQLGTQLIMTTVGVPPANGLQRIGKDAVPTNIWMQTLLQWQIMCGTGPAGAMIAGIAQENLTNRPDGTDSGWITNSSSPNFQMNQGMIFDWWSLGFVANWGSIANGGTVASCDQELRIIWTMVCADSSLVVIINPLPTVSVEVQRVDAMDYCVTASP